MINKLEDSTIRNIANVGSDVLSHKQLIELLESSGIEVNLQVSSKADRIYHSLKYRQNRDGCGNNVINFVQKVISPRRFDDELEFEKARAKFNEKLLFEGYEINSSGAVSRVTKASTISEAKERSQKIKQKIKGYNTHTEIVRFCEEEWLRENYFHAILEITKCIADKLRNMSGYTSDGSELVDECFGLGKDKKPMLAFNMLLTPSEESEHKGFANFLKGFFSMYRNPKAHNPKIFEDTQIDEMAESLIVASIIYRRLDKTFKTGLK
ncbi:TIGR02391 family protein [Pontibacter actiniarum]|uniref:TIGR02391 family protein n=1 Tax=Pontibacter actiniarum TaxID=323450 RepID=A0A1X9YV00_9BACT|nr:TIGR02391 family protein [Pontibacter actiniarum]ARS36689.1 TIGR02391 family protein [Pontibacter actiniarum]